MKVAILNDTNGPHFGCQLVTCTFREQLERVGIELIGSVHKSVKDPKRYPAFLDRADLLLVNGEGSIHHGARPELVELARRFPAALVNCVYEENPSRPELADFLFVSARESRSARALREHGVAARVIPDVIFSSNLLRNFVRPEPQLDLGLSDNVLDTDAGFSAKVGQGNVEQYLATLSQYRRLCLGRFHAVVSACVIGIPFSAWASNTHKMVGMLEDMGMVHVYAETQQEALALLPARLDEKIPRFVDDARRKIDELFENLHDLANYSSRKEG